MVKARMPEIIPDDFMFQLTEDEFPNLIFHSGISSWGGTRKMPFAFTEQGLAMLSGVLNSDDIQMVFTALRELLNPPPAPRPRIGFKRNGED